MNNLAAPETGFRSHLRIIPVWGWVLAGIGFAIAEYFFNIVVPQQDDSFTKPQCLLFGTMLGTVLAAFWLLIGYINRDARRNRMSPGLWVTVSILIPNGLGILLYFVFRELQRRPCPRCASDSFAQNPSVSL